MADFPQLELDPAILAKLRAFAKERALAPEALANEAIAEGLAAMQERLFWEERLTEENPAAALEILGRAGKGNAPDPGDELPEDFHRLLTERKA